MHKHINRGCSSEATAIPISKGKVLSKAKSKTKQMEPITNTQPKHIESNKSNYQIIDSHFGSHLANIFLSFSRTIFCFSGPLSYLFSIFTRCKRSVTPKLADKIKTVRGKSNLIPVGHVRRTWSCESI